MCFFYLARTTSTGQQPSIEPSSVGQQSPLSPPSALHAALSSQRADVMIFATVLPCASQQPSRAPSAVGQQSPASPLAAHAKLLAHAADET